MSVQVRVPLLVCRTCLAGLLMVGHPVAWSQVLYGSIVGNVRDALQAVIPEAMVTITNQDTNQVRTTTTNEQGGYGMSTVQSGTYSVRVTKSGFRPVEENNVTVTINNVARVDVTMDVGTVTENVIVPPRRQRYKPIAPRCDPK